VILYLTYWFPKAWLGRTSAVFMTATAIAPIIGGPLASLVLRLDGVLGIHGWRWLFIVEALPPLLVALAVLVFLPDRPARAPWLDAEEKRLIARRIEREDATKEQSAARALCDPRIVLLGIGYGLYLFAGYGLSFWVPLVAQQMGFSNTATGFVTALVFLAGLPGMILWARHSDRRGERIWHAALAALVMSGSFAIAAVSPGNVVVLLALSAAAVGSGSILAPYFGFRPCSSAVRQWPQGSH
jgi:ACS family tartrate transporter-like MFS transporter